MKELFFKSLAGIMLSSLLLCSCGKQEGVLTPSVPENQPYIEMYRTLIGTTWEMAPEDEQDYFQGQNKKYLEWCFQTISFGASEIKVKAKVYYTPQNPSPFLNDTVPTDGQEFTIPINTMTCVVGPMFPQWDKYFVVYNDNTSKVNDIQQGIHIYFFDAGTNKIEIEDWGASSWGNRGVIYKKVTSQSGSGSGGGSGGTSSYAGTYSFTKPGFKYNGSITLKNGTWTYDSNKEQVPAKNGTYSVSGSVITFTWTANGYTTSSKVAVSINGNTATLSKADDNSATTFFSSFFGELNGPLTFTYSN